VNDYEVLLMLDPELPEGRQGEILARTQELVTAGGGAWKSHEPWGRRRLAYEIDHKAEGEYHLLLFSSTPETLSELSRVLKITDGVMRHMATRRPRPHRRSDSEPAAAPTASEEPATPSEPEPEGGD
jgi:small subunit ribosomal protein S6